ncbi:Endonuclease, Uma2 family (restriction endonuclease fold) [Amycolatopsis xylanica]|uniref:Endonuclease, Uma2 family (Restriction endonuclease fold) n=1 Tax=Amycolatopsis xylanica TaxID=589385 RepID=A0A1H2YA96_9PSEU|nr:Uma2 family endonuclease [Amycolatopsis xylanica]SDX01758.1 Endonuclease, Uma2 family (restriction endonuclease fold) [Amycolatopsis xylanica]
MTALPEPPQHPWLTVPDHLLTIEEYSALGETDSGFSELVEGRLLMSPSPRPRHNIALGSLYVQLLPQLPPHLMAIQDVDVDLELAPSQEPGFSRRPDLIVIDRKAVATADDEDSMLKAGDVVIIVEIVSPGSKRTDYVTKHGEYADAGIPFYWIVDIADPISLVACHQAGELGHQDSPAATGTFTTTEPFPLTIDLDSLRS